MTDLAWQHEAEPAIFCLLVVLHGSHELLPIQLGRTGRQSKSIEQFDLPLRDLRSDSPQQLRQSRSRNHSNRDRLAVQVSAVARNRFDRVAKSVAVVQNGSQA